MELAGSGPMPQNIEIMNCLRTTHKSDIVHPRGLGESRRKAKERAKERERESDRESSLTRLQNLGLNSVTSQVHFLAG